jgi:uncharacterized membrane protein
MKRGTRQAYIFTLIVLIAITHIIYYYPLVPDLMASHFDSSGRPDGWSGKGTFIGVYGGAVLLMILIFIGNYFGIRRLGPRINLPGIRREETIDFLVSRLSLFCSVTLIFLIGTMHLAFRANLSEGKTLENSFNYLFIGYLVFVVAWLIGMLRMILKVVRVE